MIQHPAFTDFAGEHILVATAVIAFVAQVAHAGNVIAEDVIIRQVNRGRLATVFAGVFLGLAKIGLAFELFLARCFAGVHLLNIGKTPHNFTFL